MTTVEDMERMERLLGARTTNARAAGVSLVLWTLLTLSLVPGSAGNVSAQDRPDLSGEWRMASGVAAPRQVNIEQTAGALIIRTVGFPDAVYRFDGTETRTSHQPPIPPGSVVTISHRASWEGRQFVTKIATETTSGRRNRLEFVQETRYLDEEGRMVVEERPFTVLPMGRAGSLDWHPPMTLSTSHVRRTVYERVK